MHPAITAVVDVLFPPQCLVCDVSCGPNPLGHHLCAECNKYITEDRFDFCPRCASNAGAFADVDTGCPRCRGQSLKYDRVIRLGQYDGPLRKSILSIKQSPGENLAEVLGLTYAATRVEIFKPLNIQVFVPIPLHWRKRMQRGYNQSAAIAWGLSKGLRIPVKPWLKRNRYTPDQTSVSATARRENLKGVFVLANQANVKGLHVGVVDDVLTTGSTCSEAAMVLKAAGAAQVTAVVLAHRTGTAVVT